MQFKRHFINLQGIKLRYYTLGSGKPLLFLHGGRVRALTFKKNLELLSKHFLVIAPDLPGHGESSTPDELWTFADYAKFFDLFLEQLKLHHVIVIGYSRGGGIALYLTEISDNISQAIFIDAAGVMRDAHKVLFSDLRRLFFYLIHPQYYILLISLLKEYIFYHLKHLLDIKDVAKNRNAVRSLEYNPKNKKRVSTYILWGKDDWVLPVKHGIKLHEKLPNSKLEIVEGNHDWILYKQQLFIKKILSFLKP